MASLDMTTGTELLKEIFADKLEDLTYNKWPLLAMIPKGQWDGRKYHQPLRYGNLTGVSNTFATAQANKAGSGLESFEVTIKELHSLGSVSDVLIETSKNDAGAVQRALEAEMESGLNACMSRLSQQLFRSGSGSIGKVGAQTATTVTLTDPEDIVNFEVNQVIRADTVDGGGSVDAASEIITAVNRTTGVITGASLSDFPVDDFIFPDGDYDGGISGLLAWVPAADPSNSAFFGVDRSVDPTRLGGIRVLASEVSGAPIEEKLQILLSRVAREGGSPDVLWMNFANLRDLELSLGSKVIYNTVKAPNADVGFQAVNIIGPAGSVRVMADRHCPNNKAFALEMDTWKLRSTAGGDPSLQEGDGNSVLREASANNYEFRIRFYGNLLCSAPGHNGVIDLS